MRQAESYAIVEHCVATVGEHDRASVDAGHALTVGDGPMVQPGIDGKALAPLFSRMMPMTSSPVHHRDAESRFRNLFQDMALNCSLDEETFTTTEWTNAMKPPQFPGRFISGPIDQDLPR